MTTIHHALKDPDQVMNPSTAHGRLECAQAMRRAIEIAGRIVPGWTRTPPRTPSSPSTGSSRSCISRDVAGVQNPSPMAGPRIPTPPHRWVLRGFCKTVSADDPIRAHLLVSHILCAWQLAGLIDTIDDERGYMPPGDLRPFLGLTSADAIPTDVDTLVRLLQAAVAEVLG